MKTETWENLYMSDVTPVIEDLVYFDNPPKITNWEEAKILEAMNFRKIPLANLPEFKRETDSEVLLKIYNEMSFQGFEESDFFRLIKERSLILFSKPIVVKVQDRVQTKHNYVVIFKDSNDFFYVSFIHLVDVTVGYTTKCDQLRGTQNYLKSVYFFTSQH